MGDVDGLRRGFNCMTGDGRRFLALGSRMSRRRRRKGRWRRMGERIWQSAVLGVCFLLGRGFALGWRGAFGGRGAICNPRESVAVVFLGSGHDVRLMKRKRRRLLY